MMALVDDGVLWRRTQTGDAAAFGVLFGRHARAVHGYCFRRTGDWARAEDLTSVTFLEAWRRRDVSLPGEKVLPWLIGVATNVLRNDARALRRYRAALARLPRARAEPDFADELEERLASEQRVHEALALVRRLSRRDQEVIVLVGWQGLSTADAAFALGVREPTVRSRLSRARRRLEKLGEVTTTPPTLCPPTRSDAP